MQMQQSSVPTNKQSDESPKYSFDEAYKMITYLLVNGTKEQQDKIWKMLNEGEGEWVWMKMKVITDCYSHADAKGKEEFTLIAMQRHLDSGNAKILKETFTDPETEIVYRQYRFKSGLLYRVPIATDDMGKHAYDKALNKKFIGDYIERHSGDSITLIPLDTDDKVQAYNSGDINQKYKEVDDELIQRPERKKSDRS